MEAQGKIAAKTRGFRCAARRTGLVCLFACACSFFVSAQAELWQEQTPWEGVPEYYQHWKYPDFKFPPALSVWKKQRLEIRQTLQGLLGAIPARPQLAKVQTVFIKKGNGYTLEKFLIDNGVDGLVPGYLAIPANTKGKVPAILALHGSSSSKENVFGFASNTAQDVMALLVSNGFAVMGIDSYYNGERRGTGPAGLREMQSNSGVDALDQEYSQLKMNTWFGRSLWGMQLRDEMLALDYLSSRPEIDPGKIGAEGMSMGSTQSWWLTALDDRIKVVVGVACFTHYQELIQQRELRAHDLGYFVPGMLLHFDTEAVMGLIAPRPFLVLTGDSDPGSPVSGIKVLEKKLDTVYGLYQGNALFKSIIYPKTGHVYTDDMKMEMVAWFNKHLK